MDINELLKRVKDGTLSVEEAAGYLKRQPFDELGYAKLDSHREIRSGFPEVVYCSGKPDEYLVSIYRRLYEADGEVFGTRASAHQYELVKKVLPEVTYDSVSRILKIEKEHKPRSETSPCAVPERRIFPWPRRRLRRRSILGRR